MYHRQPAKRPLTLVGIGLIIALLACNLPSAVDTPDPSPPPEDTPAAATSQSPAQTNTDLAVWQILLRYDGALLQGTLEATICNIGSSPSQPFEVVITANGVSRQIAAQEGLAPQKCAAVFDQQASFETFGITQLQSVSVKVEVFSIHSDDPPSNNLLEQDVDIPVLIPRSDPNQVAEYQECRNEFEHWECIDLLYGEPAAVDPLEVKKQWGDYAAIVPYEYEAIAALALADLRLCTEDLEAYLGIPLPVEPIYEHFALSEEISTNYASAVHIVLIARQNSPYFSDLAAGAHVFINWENVFTGKCSQAHELAHVFVANTHIPGWLNEGLATYMAQPGRVEWFSEAAYRCEETGWTDLSPYGSQEFTPYVPLDEKGEDLVDEVGNYYITGACFWDYFETTYGKEAFQQVVQLMALTDLTEECPPFLPTFVQPIIGQDISDVTFERFGFDNEFSMCTNY